MKRRLDCEVALGNTSLMQHAAVCKINSMELRENPETNLTDRTYIPRPWPRPILTSYVPRPKSPTQLKKAETILNSSIPFEPVPNNYSQANQTSFPCTADDVTHAPIIPSCTFTNGNVECNEWATLAWTVFTVLLLLIAICININSIRGKSFVTFLLPHERDRKW